MKTTLLTVAISACAISLFAQGTVQFNNRNTAAGLFVPIYGLSPGNVAESKTGNSAIALPAGTQTYAGAFLTGSGYMAQLFSAPGANAPESALVASPNSITTFRTGISSGAFAAVTAVLANVPLDAAVATLQVRAWDNSSGLYVTWAAAETAWMSGTTAAGKSALWNLNAIGGNLNTPPLPVGMQSFNLWLPGSIMPEPSTYALFALGGLGLWLFRRKK